ncbi:DUF2971 domain-containing protein [Mesorhizobium sp. ASY16-5R]|uniref:DUF2971 domain-containing protein n=1 Tax=Mesorhizobium sp. ASY16-5R TaxID=3445772 RepID=UPI003F9F420A
MQLYKFVDSAEAVKKIAAGSLKFTPIEELNDPSELTPVMDRLSVRESLDAIRKNGMTGEQFGWLQRQEALLDLLSPEQKTISAPTTIENANYVLKSIVYDNFEYMEIKLFETIKNIKSRVGILSLTQRYDSLPMWAHYADLAKGVVLILNNLEKTFNGDRTGILNIPKSVVYADRFPGMTFDPSTQDRLFFTKLSDWSYEREWRIVTALSDCHRPSGGNLYLRNVNPLHLTGVICGWRTPPDIVSSLGIELRHINPKAKLTSAVMEGGTVHLRP